MINIDSKLLDALQQSTCFGIAHDDSVPECKQCDVKAQCKAKGEGASIPTPKGKPKSQPTGTAAEPSTPAVQASGKSAKSGKSSGKAGGSSTKKNDNKPAGGTKPASTPKPASQPAQQNGNMPDFKPMGLEELKALAAERKVDWKDYGNDQITRMRLIMNLKKSY